MCVFAWGLVILCCGDQKSFITLKDDTTRTTWEEINLSLTISSATFKVWFRVSVVLELVRS